MHTHDNRPVMLPRAGRMMTPTVMLPRAGKMMALVCGLVFLDGSMVALAGLLMIASRLLMLMTAGMLVALAGSMLAMGVTLARRLMTLGPWTSTRCSLGPHGTRCIPHVAPMLPQPPGRMVTLAGRPMALAGGMMRPRMMGPRMVGRPYPLLAILMPSSTPT